ncbi:ATP-binding protein [Crocinitomicaceae bacterium]|nr:ATP-binding protein [Crocinitomicaceae bacterium]
MDPRTSMLPNLVVVATSNGVDGLDRALLQRFRRYTFDSGPRFAQSCRQEIVRRWRAEAGDAPLPHDWTKWGQDGEDFSMRLALQELEDHLCVEVAA